MNISSSNNIFSTESSSKNFSESNNSTNLHNDLKLLGKYMTSDSISHGGSTSDVSSSMADLKNSFNGMKSKSSRKTMTTPNMSNIMSPISAGMSPQMPQMMNPMSMGMSPQMNPMSMGMSMGMSPQMNPMAQMSSLLGQPSQGPSLDGIPEQGPTLDGRSQQGPTLDGNIEKSLNPELSAQLENYLEGGNNSSTSLDLSHASESLNGGSIRQMNTNSHVAPQTQSNTQPQQSMGSNSLESFILNNVPQGYSGEVHPMLANSLPMPSGGMPMMMSQPSMSFDLNSGNLPLDVQHALGHNNQGANLPMSEYAMPGMYGGKKHKKRRTKKN